MSEPNQTCVLLTDSIGVDISIKIHQTKIAMRSARALICLLLLAIGFLFFLPKTVVAQTNTYSNSNSYNTPNLDPEVPRNQHTFAQSAAIEVLSAVHCILTGIDPIDTNQGCLGVNPQTKKLGLSKPPVDELGQLQPGGLLVVTTQLVASTYQPTVSTNAYLAYLSDNFGLVKKAHAADACDPNKNGFGFCGLQPILKLWEVVRNISYSLLTLAFIFIGLGIMLRVKIDPRTVMSIQNQIPKTIIAIILITFSYAISALMVDTMWTTTYAGIYLLTDHRDPEVGDCKDSSGPEKLSEKATKTILQTPITYFNQIFARCSPEDNIAFLPQNHRDGGFHVMTMSVSNNFGQVIGNVARSLIFDNVKEEDCGYNPFKCAKKFLKTSAVGILETLVTIVVTIVIFVILIVTLFRLWFQLLKAFIFSLIYIMVGPIYIVFGLLPTKPLGFEKWMRALFVNIAVFPLTAYMFVIARLMMDLYQNTGPSQFIPPLVGNPAAGVNFGALLAFGVILITPSVNTILKEKMGVKGIGSPGLVAGAIAGGAAVIGAPVSRAMKHLNRTDSQGKAVGALAVGKQMAGNWALGKGANAGIPLMGRQLARRKAIQGRAYHESEHSAGKKGVEEYNKIKQARAEQLSGMSKAEQKEQKKKWREIDRKESPNASRAVSRWRANRRRRKNGGDDPGTGSSSPTGSPGGGSGGDRTKTIGEGDVELKGPVTATGQIIAKGGSELEAKNNLAMGMFENYNRLQTANRNPISASQQITIKNKLKEKMNSMSQADVERMGKSDWDNLLKTTHDKAKQTSE